MASRSGPRDTWNQQAQVGNLAQFGQQCSMKSFHGCDRVEPAQVVPPDHFFVQVAVGVVGQVLVR